jgi:hypothetical protein
VYILSKEFKMALSREAREILVVALANRAKATEIADAIDAADNSADTSAIAVNAAAILALETSLNSLLDELEARRDAAETLADSADGFYEGLKIS